MKKIVLRYGILSGFILMSLSAVVLPLCMNGVVNFDHQEIFGYTAMVLSFLLVFFGVRKYRDTVGGGAIGFGKAVQVGLLISLVTCAMYVIGWEIAYFNFFPHFLDNYNAHALAKMRAGGASEAAIRAQAAQMADLAKRYQNPLFNSALTFLEVFPVGLVVTLVSAGILRRKSGPGEPVSAVPAMPA